MKHTQDDASQQTSTESLVPEAYLLDNERRHDMGYPHITFNQFLECVNHPTQCVPDDTDCEE
ncbi:MAG: hypothetical protein ACW960_15300 [Candidatus Thorarchaeota archaeon]